MSRAVVQPAAAACPPPAGGQSRELVADRFARVLIGCAGGGYNAPSNRRGGDTKSQFGCEYASQQFVYQGLGRGVLNNALNGFNCCLFAYGQTGSGKSYSFVGYGSNKGIVPQVCDEIFKRKTGAHSLPRSLPHGLPHALPH